MPDQPPQTTPAQRRHVPQRTCIACRATDAKRALIRLVRLADGRVAVDPTGRQAGRGATYAIARRAGGRQSNAAALCGHCALMPCILKMKPCYTPMHSIWRTLWRLSNEYEAGCVGLHDARTANT